jgi:hypothetical protein
MRNLHSLQYSEFHNARFPSLAHAKRAHYNSDSSVTQADDSNCTFSNGAIISSMAPRCLTMQASLTRVVATIFLVGNDGLMLPTQIFQATTEPIA